MNARAFRAKSGRGLGALDILNARSFRTPSLSPECAAFLTFRTHLRCHGYPERTCIQCEIRTRLRRTGYPECARNQDAAHPSLTDAHSGYSGRIRDVRNIRRKGPFSETDELSTIYIKFRKVVGNLPLLGATLFRTLIADGDPPLPCSFYRSHR